MGTFPLPPPDITIFSDPIHMICLVTSGSLGSNDPWEVSNPSTIESYGSYIPLIMRRIMMRFIQPQLALILVPDRVWDLINIIFLIRSFLHLFHMTVLTMFYLLMKLLWSSWPLAMDLGRICITVHHFSLIKKGWRTFLRPLLSIMVTINSRFPLWKLIHCQNGSQVLSLRPF